MFLKVDLLSRYLRDQIMSNPNGDCVKRVCKEQLFCIQKLYFYFGNLRVDRYFANNDAFFNNRLKSLELTFDRFSDWNRNWNYLDLNLPNLQCLQINWTRFDLNNYDPFVNLNNLRQLHFDNCEIVNAPLDFFQKFPNLEKFHYRFYPIKINPNEDRFLFPINYISSLKNLKVLILEDLSNRMIDVDQNLDFFKDMTNLVVIRFDWNNLLLISENTFLKLNNLEQLEIGAKKGEWMRHLGNLKSLFFRDLDSEDFEFDYIDNLTKLGKLHMSFTKRLNVWRSGACKGLKQLKSLSLRFWIYKIEENAFEGLENLTELELFFNHYGFKISLKSDLFKSLNKLKKLSIDGQVDIDKDLLETLPNLKSLSLTPYTRFDLTERTFSKNQKLEKLEISYSQIETLPFDVFLNLSNLTHMSLCSNRLTTLNECSFNGLDNLKELNLSDNPFSEFNMGLLPKMPKLKRLILSSSLVNDLMKFQLHDLNIDIFFY